jgi:hypothetical protein
MTSSDRTMSSKGQRFVARTLSQGTLIRTDPLPLPPCEEPEDHSKM